MHSHTAGLDDLIQDLGVTVHMGRVDSDPDLPSSLLTHLLATKIRDNDMRVRPYKEILHTIGVKYFTVTAIHAGLLFTPIWGGYAYGIALFRLFRKDGTGEPQRALPSILHRGLFSKAARAAMGSFVNPLQSLQRGYAKLRGATMPLTEEQRQAIREEEFFRNEVRKDLAGQKGPPGFLERCSAFLETKAGFWLLTTVLAGLQMHQIQYALRDGHDNRTAHTAKSCNRHDETSGFLRLH